MNLLIKFIKFGIVGFVGLVIDFSITWLLKEKLKVNKFIANGFGFITAATVNYFINRIWTFQSKNLDIQTEYFNFIIVSIIGLGINSLVLWFLIKKFNLNFYISKLFAIIITTIWNFGANLLFTFA